MPSSPDHGTPRRNPAAMVAKARGRASRILPVAAIGLASLLAAGPALAQDDAAAYQALGHALLPGHAHHAAHLDRQEMKIHKVAKEYEGVFLTEMLRLARPPDQAAPGFSAGQSGGTWQVFMDRALGKAAAENGGTGLGKQIETALRGRQGKREAMR